jgi:hypothetical protein
MKTLPKQDGVELDPSELKDMLVSLAQSKYWRAIKQYNRGRDIYISQSLRSLNPATQATEMARVQGMSMGLYDLETGMEEELKRIREEEEEAEKLASEKKS